MAKFVISGRQGPGDTFRKLGTMRGVIELERARRKYGNIQHLGIIEPEGT